jgi:hypothetical protein
MFGWPLATGGRTRICKWIRSLGLAPELIELETLQEGWVEAEQFWIEYLIALGCRLTNGTRGGEGAPGRPVSSETRARIGAKHKGKVINLETRKKMSAAPRSRTDSHREAIRRAQIERSTAIDVKVRQAVEGGATMEQLAERGFSSRAIGRGFGVCHHTVRVRLA